MNQHRRAFAQMSLGDGSHMHGHNHTKQPGALSAVIESASQNSGTTRSISTNSLIKGGGGGHSRGDASRSVRSDDKSRASSTIATHSSMGTRNSFRSFGTLPPRGQCLTQPSEGVSNDNLCDNAEGNLIVYENDNISVPKKQVCVLTPGKIPKGASSSDFRVQSLLGQGTFAQVFRCLHVQTGQLVAVKIVKNKPAYTRQAAVEIDVIRALSTTTPNETTNSRKSNNGNSNDRSSTITEGLSPKNSSDYMIDMVCYFLYKDHLCLVFELLGLNLYEVLKKRQFRGLPLVVTQTLVRQAVLGARDLAQKSIVHCDLKPENILLVDEDDSESVMSAGESKRVHALSLHNKQQIEQQKLLGRSTTESNPNKDTIEGNNKSNVNDNTNEGQTQSSDNTKSTTETDNMTRKNEERQHQQPTRQEKSNGWPASKSPMESTIATIETQQYPTSSHHRIKLIDFGSACFEGQMSHTYIQSRFYRSPEVLLGLAYDSAIDMWSLGCVAAELFLGLPILPGVHEHDQLGRIIEMIGDTPDWMLDQGTKSSKYFVKYVPAATPTPPIQSSSATPPIRSSSTTPESRSGSTEATATGRSGSEAPRPLPQWRIKTQHEYIASLSHSDIEKKGGLTKLQKQPGNRYFKRRSLSDIILHKGETGKQEDLRLLKSFIHFIYGKY
jgi:serine/threonine protein kinase